MSRFVGALYWTILGIGAGAIEGAAIGWMLDWGSTPGALLGAGIAGGVGFVAGLFRPKSSSKGSAKRARYNLKRCAWCGGSGLERKRKSQRPCTVCDGQGKLLTPQPSPRCPKCKGKGRVSFGKKCKVCYGAGWERYAHLDGVAV